jgi:hypothetical protein
LRSQGPHLEGHDYFVVLLVIAANTLGNVGPYLSEVRTQAMHNIDTVLSNNFPLGTAAHPFTATFHIETYNFAKHGPIDSAERNPFLGKFPAGNVDGKQSSESAVRPKASLLMREVQCC